MSTKLEPQIFDEDAETLVPAYDFFEESKKTLPQIYLNAEKFMDSLKAILSRKQYLYDAIRSLVNVYNLNSSDVFTKSTPTGVYLEMLASNTNTKFTAGATDTELLEVIGNQLTFVNSRGNFADFYRYFAINNLSSYFNSDNVKEVGNATLSIKMPVSSGGVPDALTVLIYDLFKLKSAGIEININQTEPDYFAFSILDNPVTPARTAGWATIDSRGIVSGGGFFRTLS